jgi:hypothetical protein
MDTATLTTTGSDLEDGTTSAPADPGGDGTHPAPHPARHPARHPACPVA